MAQAPVFPSALLSPGITRQDGGGASGQFSLRITPLLLQVLRKYFVHGNYSMCTCWWSTFLLNLQPLHLSFNETRTDATAPCIESYWMFGSGILVIQSCFIAECTKWRDTVSLAHAGQLSLISPLGRFRAVITLSAVRKLFVADIFVRGAVAAIIDGAFPGRLGG